MNLDRTGSGFLQRGDLLYMGTYTPPYEIDQVVKGQRYVGIGRTNGLVGRQFVFQCESCGYVREVRRAVVEAWVAGCRCRATKDRSNPPPGSKPG